MDIYRIINVFEQFKDLQKIIGISLYVGKVSICFIISYSVKKNNKNNTMKDCFFFFQKEVMISINTILYIIALLITIE